MLYVPLFPQSVACIPPPNDDILRIICSRETLVLDSQACETQSQSWRDWFKCHGSLKK